jgi:hypothetical protein
MASSGNTEAIDGLVSPWMRFILLQAFRHLLSPLLVVRCFALGLLQIA